MTTFYVDPQDASVFCDDALLEEETSEHEEDKMLRNIMAKKITGMDTPALGIDLSAPYEAPQLPIEQLESKLLTVRKKSGCPSVSNNAAAHQDDLDFEDYVPQYQRVNISGEDITGVTM